MIPSTTGLMGGIAISTPPHTKQHTPTGPHLHVPSTPMAAGEDSHVHEEEMVEEWDVHLPAVDLRPRGVQSASVAHNSPI